MILVPQNIGILDLECQSLTFTAVWKQDTMYTTHYSHIKHNHTLDLLFLGNKIIIPTMFSSEKKQTKHERVKKLEDHQKRCYFFQHTGKVINHCNFLKTLIRYFNIFKDSNCTFKELKSLSFHLHFRYTDVFVFICVYLYFIIIFLYFLIRYDIFHAYILSPVFIPIIICIPREQLSIPIPTFKMQFKDLMHAFMKKSRFPIYINFM